MIFLSNSGLPVVSGEEVGAIGTWEKSIDRQQPETASHNSAEKTKRAETQSAEVVSSVGGQTFHSSKQLVSVPGFIKSKVVLKPND